MEKRLSRSDYLFALMFILLLICAIGAFFYGYQMGQQTTTAKYELLNKKKEEKPKLTAYHQQYLVSFYHTIYLPYREFQKKWFEHMDTIELQSSTVDPSSLMKELAKLAKEKYLEIVNISMPDSSPLLQEAQQNYVKSLKLFSDASGKFISKANSMNGDSLINEIEKDAYFQEAKNFALQAQKSYFDSIVMWNKSINPELTGIELAVKKNLTLNEWKQLNLNLKNQFISGILAGGKYYTSFQPQDVTVTVDQLILSGQAEKTNLNEIQQIVDMFVNTGAVRQGDFIKQKDRFYIKQTLPQLPFFFDQN